MSPQVTQDQAVNSARQVVTSLTSGTAWINSWWAPEADKLFCEWEAPNADAIRVTLESARELLPIEAIYEVQQIRPEWYD
jgi:hypothetical protein